MKKVKNRKLLVSVVMPVYNAGEYAAEAIESVLLQTYDNFEFLILDDGSTDNSRDIIRKYASGDKRIRLIVNRSNKGIGYGMNKLVKEAKGDYIARMDADDVMMPMRLETQVSYLMKNPNVGVVGSYMIEVDKDGKTVGARNVPTEHEAIYRGFATRQTIQNPSVMINKRNIPKDELYFDNELSPMDDLEFLMRVGAKTRLANIPEYLMIYRSHGENSSLVDIKKSFSLTEKVREQALDRGFAISGKEKFIRTLQKTVVSILPRRVLYTVFRLSAGVFPARKAIDYINGVGEISLGDGLSLVMPSYRDGKSIRKNVSRIIEFLRARAIKHEVIVVVDGKVDNTANILQSMRDKYPELCVVSYAKNKGKGHAVKEGIRLAKYGYAGFMDTGSDISLLSLDLMLRQISNGEVASAYVADKFMTGSVMNGIPVRRHIFSYGFRAIIRVLFGNSMPDTQTGLKIFRTPLIKKTIEGLEVDVTGFAFDVEIMEALLRGGNRIASVPVSIDRDMNTKSSVNLSSTLKMVIDLVRVRIANIAEYLKYEYGIDKARVQVNKALSVVVGMISR